MTGKEIDQLELKFEAAKSHFYTTSYQAEVIAQLAREKGALDGLLDILLKRDVTLRGADGQVDAIGDKALEDHVDEANNSVDAQVKKLAQLHNVLLEDAYKDAIDAANAYGDALSTSYAMAKKAEKLEAAVSKIKEKYSQDGAAMTAVKDAELGQD